jgi:parallel beta-helix repeat protein
MNIWLSDEIRDYYQNVDSNTINGKPLYYLLNESGLEINGLPVGGIYVVNCTDCIISNVEISDTVVGIEIDYSSNITLLNSKFKDNVVSSSVVSSSNCTIIGNEISNDDWDAMQIWNIHNTRIISNDFLNNRHGIRLLTRNGWEPSYDNLIYHNNFIDNLVQAYDTGNNIWDDGYPSGGNYWSDYTGTDSDGDGIGDVPYNIQGDDNKDRYPLMEPWVDEAPYPPAKPSGPTNGGVGTEYTYTSSTTDPDGDNLYYLFDWGDDTFEDWFGLFESGEEVTASHTWDEQGTYQIRVKAKDIYGVESEWSDPLHVSMPKSKEINFNTLFLKFLEQHPRMFPILRHLLGV